MTARRDTAQQRAIRSAIESAGRPLSVHEVHERAAEVVPTLALCTVYRVLNRLLGDGDIAAVSVPGQPDRYEPVAIAATHHHHFRCEVCDRLYDVCACPGGLQRLLPKGFVLAGHELHLWGRCPHCAA